MAERAAWRPPWYLWPAFGATLLALIHRQAPYLLHGQWLFFLAIGVLGLLLAIAVLWELPVAATMSVAIVLTIFSGSWESLGLPGFPFVPDRILLAVALLALLLRSPGAVGLPRVQVKGVHLLLAATTIYACGSAAVAGTLWGKAGLFDLLDRLGAIPFLMLLVAPVVFPGARERNMLLSALVGLGAYLGVTALFETVGPHALVFPRYILSADSLTPVRQAGGPFRAAISDGFACFACGTAAAVALTQWRGRRRRLFARFVLGICVLGVFCSLERGVWLAAAAGALAVGISAPELRRFVIPGVLAVAIVIGGALVVFPSLAGHATERASDQTPVWDRENQTATALRMIAARPLFGFGWDNYVNESTEYFRQAPGYPMTGFSTSDNPLPLHDSYLSNAVELGLVGLVMWVLSLAWGLGGAIFGRGSPELRPWRLGLLAVAVFFCVLAFFDPLQQNFTELLLWIWAGLCLPGRPVLAPCTAEGRRRAPAPRAQGRLAVS